MAMVILRAAKLKTMGNVAASLSHTYRTRTTPNADAERFDTNTLERSPLAVVEDLKAKLPDKRRKDAVLAIEYMVSASPEWFEGKTREQQDAFFAGAKKWLQERHGDNNLLDFSIHRDEKSPHAIAYVVPLDEGKLNAKRWLGGRAVLSKMQTDFANQVGLPHGLERGIEGSRATHTTVKEFYAALNAPLRKTVSMQVEVLEPRLVEKGFIRSTYESPEMVAQRLSDGINKHFAPALKQAEQAALLRRREAEQDKTIKALGEAKKSAEGRLKRLGEEFSDLMELSQISPGGYQQVKAMAKALIDQEKKKKQGEEIEKEKQRRVDEWHLLKRSVGTDQIYYLEAAKAARHGEINWSDLEVAVVRTAISKYNRDSIEVIDSINANSPLRADSKQHANVMSFVKQHEPAWRAEYRQQKDSDRGLER